MVRLGITNNAIVFFALSIDEEGKQRGAGPGFFLRDASSCVKEIIGKKATYDWEPEGAVCGPEPCKKLALRTRTG